MTVKVSCCVVCVDVVRRVIVLSDFNRSRYYKFRSHSSVLSFEICVLIIPTKSGDKLQSFCLCVSSFVYANDNSMLWTDWDEIVMASCAVVSVARRFDFEPQTHIGRDLNNRNKIFRSTIRHWLT